MRSGGAEVPQAGGWWCRHCGERVTVTGDDPRFGKAVHAVTGSETGPPGGHVAAPIDVDPAGWPAARAAGDCDEVTAAMLRETFDAWRIFELDGRHWATRGGGVTTAGPRSLIHPVVCAMTLEGLAEQLSLQEWLRRMTAAELEAVWRDGLAAVAR
jgi:hypothetical protein